MDGGKRPRNLPSASNSEDDDLKDIIIEHALPFLPAKSLFRFLAVCRDWKLHISAPSFHHNQSLCCRGISGLFCQTLVNAPAFINGRVFINHPVFVSMHPKSSGVPDPSLRFLPEQVVIRASSNGLLCCQGHNDKRYYYLCNPVTKQWKKLPKPTACHGSDPALVLIFEPSLLNFVAEYKLICAFESTEFDDATEFEIYTSKNNSWNVSGEIFFGAKKADLGSGVHVNGVVYWIVVSGDILSFDLTKDRSQLLQNDNKGTNCLLGTFDGRLCKVSILDNEVLLRILLNIHANTMQMHPKPKMWQTVRYALCPGDTYIPFGDIGTTVVAVGRDFVVAKSWNKLYSYGFDSEETKALSLPAEPYYEICVPYVNSLVSL